MGEHYGTRRTESKAKANTFANTRHHPANNDGIVKRSAVFFLGSGPRSRKFKSCRPDHFSLTFPIVSPFVYKGFLHFT